MTLLRPRPAKIHTQKTRTSRNETAGSVRVKNFRSKGKKSINGVRVGRTALAGER